MRVNLMEGLLFLYITSLFAFSSYENLSWLTNFFVLLLLVMLVYKARRSKIVLLTWFVVLIFMNLTLAFASTLWSYEIRSSLSAAVRFATTLAGPAVVFLVLMNGSRYEVVFFGTILGTSILTVSAYLEYTRSYVSRASGIANNPNALALTLILASVVLLCTRSKFPVLSHVFVLFFLGFGVFTTGSRKMVVSIALFAFYYVYLVMLARKFTVRRLLSFILLLLIGYLFLFAVGDDISSLIEGTQVFKRTERALLGTESSYSTREAMISYGIFLWSQRPILGYGMAQFRFLGLWNYYSHNNYIEMLVNSGIIGLLLYYSIHLLIIARAFTALSGLERAYVVFAVVLLIILDVSYVSYREKVPSAVLGILVWMTSYSRNHRMEGVLDGFSQSPAEIQNLDNLEKQG